MKRTFCKMHGVGNDYIYFDCFEEGLPRPAALAKRLSDRRFSVGGDGIVLILPSRRADARMRMFNADGSEGKMCGNAVRCVAKYLYDVRGMKKETFTVETKSGVKLVKLVQTRRGEACAFTVDMGRPVFVPEKIPALFAGERVVAQPLAVGGETYRVTCLSMGNPHCVVFGDDPEGLDVARLGALFESHPAFPERVNTEFVQVLGANRLKMRVFERGSGETLACGTGACAAAVAAVLCGYADLGADVSVCLRGGELHVVYTGETVFLTGPAQLAFTGVVEIHSKEERV